MPAATRAPNTSSSKTSVTGSEIPSALPKFVALLIACWMLASPDSAMSRSGWRACTVATACWSVVAAWSMSATLPGTSNVTRALRPSLRHQRLPAVRQRGADAGGVLGLGRQRGRHLARGLPHRRIGAERDAGSPGLDQHGLGIGPELGGRGLVQHALGLPGLPGVVLREVRRAERLGRDENPDDQQQPAEDSGLAVPGAPAGDALGQDAGARPGRSPACRQQVAGRARTEVAFPGILDCAACASHSVSLARAGVTGVSRPWPGPRP